MNTRIANITIREAHLIDIENELGKGNPTAAEIALFRDFYLSMNNVPGDAQIIIGASSDATLLEVAIGWPGVRRVFRPGKDGADKALLEVALDENLDLRFGKVVIGSGDHAFTEAVDALQFAGVTVEVFARDLNTHHSLFTHCRNVHTFSVAQFALAA